MTPRDVSLAALMSLCWGLAFVATKIALESFTPLQLTGLRFLIACAPVAFVARPQASWLELVSIGATLFGAQFLLLFLAFTQGLPPGVASVTQQIQAMFTVLLTAVFLREFPTPRQWSGMTIAFAGLALVGWTAGTDLKPLGLALGLAAALSW
ncbi:MAG TPA: EamA family transporter, partial [bacterium]|nr:EamA family transporter [bacterium]